MLSHEMGSMRAILIPNSKLNKVVSHIFLFTSIRNAKGNSNETCLQFGHEGAATTA
jgi:hypothetical protein